MRHDIRERKLYLQRSIYKIAKNIENNLFKQLLEFNFVTRNEKSRIQNIY